MDRPALLVDDGLLARTPATQARERRARLAIDVDKRGDARYGYRVEDQGFTAELERNVFRRATPARAVQIARERLRRTGLRATASVETGDLSASNGPFDVATTGVLEHLVWPDGVSAFPAWSSFAGGIASQIEGWLAEPVRTQSYVCVDGVFDEEGVVTLPSDLTLVFMPADVTVDAGPIEYAAHYVFDSASRALQISRRLQARFGKQVCSPHEFDAMRDALLRIERDTSAQIVVQEKAVRPMR
jgi:hypothetical protein